MRELYKMNEEEKNIFQLSLEDDHYFVYKDNKELFGFAKIACIQNVMVSIFILPEKRSNGYGKELFLKVLQYLKNLGISSFELKIPLSNMIMCYIAEKSGGVEITRTNGMIGYVFSL